MDSFNDIAPYYDNLMDQVPYRMWVGYLLLLWSQQGVKPLTVLDVCCGTGNVSDLMEDEGYQVTGFDLSAQMIEKAKSKAAQSGSLVEYLVADATAFDFKTKFDAAYSFFDSLNYITTAEGFRSAVFQVAKHLKPGGSFIFDLNTRYAFDQRMFDQQSLRKDAKLRYRWRGDWDPETLQIAVKMKFWADGKEFIEVHRQRAHPDEEVRAVLADAGFIDVRSYHSYSLELPRATSDRVHYTAILAS